MRRSKNRYTLLLIFLAFFPLVCPANRPEIYRAYIDNRMDIWKSIIDKLEADKPGESDDLLELVNYQYGYIGYCIGFKKREEAKKYLDLAEKNIKILEKRNYDPSNINAYKCAFYGFRMGLNKLTAPVYGIKSIDHARSAIKLGGDNYFAFIQYGNILFYMPATFGGSKEEGIEYFLKAKAMLEKNKEGLNENWNYLSLLVIIGQSYTYLNQFGAAKAVYEDILKLEPDFLYIKNELYPDLLKKINSV